MRTLHRAAVSSTVAGLVLTCIIGVPAALAHEQRTVGSYHFTVGFGDEPAYAGTRNSLELIIADAADKPVTDIGDTLSVEVVFGDQRMKLPLEPNFEVGEFGTPGDYRAWFVPTRPGAYTFHVSGSIGGQAVDQTFTSSPTTFSEVQDQSAVEFPVKDPTVAQLSERIDREVPRLNDAIASVRTDAQAQDDSRRAITIGSVAIAVIALLAAVAAIGLASRARARAPGGGVARPGPSPRE